MLEIKKGVNRFYIGESEENFLGEISYTSAGEKIIIIDHTFVSDELSGQGLAGKLLKELVDWARKEEKKVIPLCPYAKAKMDKTEKYQDVLYKPE